jgi:hypothetical protein
MRSKNLYGLEGHHLYLTLILADFRDLPSLFLAKLLSTREKPQIMLMLNSLIVEY